MPLKRKTISIVIGVGLVFAMGFGLAARMMSPSGSIIPRDVVAGGGGRSAATSGHVQYSTIGQPATAISTAGNGTVLVGGFQAPFPRSSTAVRHWQLY